MNEGPILVVGAGSWGTALAVLLARNGHPTILWAHRPEHAAQLARERRNERYLPGIELPPGLTPDDDLEAALAHAQDVIVAVPCTGLRGVFEQIAVFARPGLRLSWACKGIEYDTGLLAHQIAARYFGEDCPTAVISGPTFAGEVAAGLPTAVVVASADGDFAKSLAGRLHGGRFRAYLGSDVIGVEVGGAVKNVLAIAAGVSDGLGFGANSRAALVTRGLAEIVRLGVALGGRRETFMGLTGLGDLVLTCTQDQSRNRRFGLAIAAGQSPGAALAGIGQAVEGVRTAAAVERLATEHGVDMPIAVQVARLLREECTPPDAVEALLGRDLKPELEPEEL